MGNITIYENTYTNIALLAFNNNFNLYLSCVLFNRNDDFEI
jgi:hypothetical protein